MHNYSKENFTLNKMILFLAIIGLIVNILFNLPITLNSINTLCSNCIVEKYGGEIYGVVTNILE